MVHQNSKPLSQTPRINVAIFASGGGSNAEAIIHYACRTAAAFRVALLVSNNSRCGAMERALMFNIPTLHISSTTHSEPQEYSSALVQSLRDYNVELIALAGYMKKIPQEVVQAFSPRGHSRIFNIHPSLLPKFGGHGMYGLAVHKAVIAAGEQESGCTVHEVDGEYDTGTILAQRTVSVLPTDTPEILAERVLKQEHELYPDTLQQQALAIQNGLL